MSKPFLLGKVDLPKAKPRSVQYGFYMYYLILFPPLKARASSFVPSDKGSKALCFVDDSFIIKESFSPPPTANLPKRFGLAL